MNAVPAVLSALYDGERALEQDLLATAERHIAEHEVHHVCIDLARWSHEHAARIARAAESHGLHLLAPAADAPTDRPPIRRENTQRHAHALDEPGQPDLSLLNDLRELHLAATGISLDWEMLAQAAGATADSHLLGLAGACHPQVLRQMRWTNTMLKTLSPQLLSNAKAPQRADGSTTGPGIDVA